MGLFGDRARVEEVKAGSSFGADKAKVRQEIQQKLAEAQRKGDQAKVKILMQQLSLVDRG